MMSAFLYKARFFHMCSKCLNRTSTYKSIYNVENLYPASKDLFLTFSSKPSPENTDPEKFSGEIPVKKLTIKYSKSSGAGGQHVNKTLTKAEVRFNVINADWLPENLRSVILQKFRNRVNKEGELIVRNDDSRYQMNNLKNCLDQIRNMIKEAERPPDRSKEERIAQLNDMESIERAHKKRLVKKRMQSYTKSMRRSVD